MSAGPGPLRVMTLDGAVWVRAAVTRSGLGLYCPESVTSCPRFVMATLEELAEHGVKVAPAVTELADAVALMGALPMPTPTPGELAEQRHLVDPLDHVMEHLADKHPAVAPADPRRAASVSKLQALLARQSGGAQ